MTTSLFLPDGDATDALARVLASSQPMPAVVYLQGDLGAGKSTLARAWLRALGVVGAVRSPTYTLVERYPLHGRSTNGAIGGAAREALHLDLYRIAQAAELEFLALDDAQTALWLVEWPERGASALPPADLRIELAVSGAGRSGRLDPVSPLGQAWLSAESVSGGLRQFYEPRG